MPQTDLNVANASGPAVRADLNDHLEAIATRQSGSSYPSTTFPHQIAVNTTLGISARRNAANSGFLLETTEDETRVLARASNTMLGISDHTKFIVATGSFTQTFDTCANLTEWWHCWYRNDGTGSIVLDPSGSEQINGQANLTLSPGDGGIIVNTGSALKFLGIARPTAATIQVFTSSSTWTKPSGLRDVMVEVIGGGGGGGGATVSGDSAPGGGGGGYSRKRIGTASLGATETVTVGSGGAGGAANGSTNGQTGGTSSFGAHCSATGGTGGATANGGGSTPAPVSGGVGSGGDINAKGGGSHPGVLSNFGGHGGNSALGGGGIGTLDSVGEAGGNYGGGGGGARCNSSSSAGGAGAGGVVIVTEFY